MIFKWVVIIFCLTLACLFLMAGPVREGTLPSFVLDSAVAAPAGAGEEWIVYAIGIAVGISVTIMIGISNEIGGALNNNNGRSFITALLGLAVFIACGLGLAWISYWSFQQTAAFFRTATGNKENAIYWSMFFQYGQNVFLFLSQKLKGRKVQIAPKFALDIGVLNLMAFVLFCTIDGGTNIAEWQEENAAIAFSISWYSALMYPSLIIIVFVEELLIYVAAAIAHQLNDVFESLGFGRMQILDSFTAGASGSAFGGGGGGGGFSPQAPQGPRQGGPPPGAGRPGGTRFQGPTSRK